MALTPATLTTATFVGSAYLHALTDDVDELAARRASTSPTPEAVEHARSSSLRATLALDGARPDATGGWLDLVRADAAGENSPNGPHDASEVDPDAPAHDERLQAREIFGAGRALDADDLAAPLTTAPRETLEELHRRLVDGLVAADRSGQPRTTEQLVHDASTGRVLYWTVPPDRIDDELDRLAAWMRSSGEVAPLLRAGLVHVELLRIHPFDAANGRLARAAARLMLRDAGLDPFRLTAFEVQLADAPLAYHEQVAGALRRREPTVWLEYWAETVAAALQAATPAAASTRISDPLRRFVDDHEGEVVTIAELARELDDSPDSAVRSLLDHGLADRVRGSRGLRLRISEQH